MADETEIILPEGFRRVEYLQSLISTNGAYAIDTGIKPNQNTGFWVDFNEIYDTTTGTQQSIFGGRNGSSNKELQLTRYTNGILRFNTGSYSANFNLRTRYQISLKNRVFTHYDGTQTTLPDTEWQSDYNIYLFCLNNGGQLCQGGSTQIYRIKFYDSDNLIRDFIPCLDTDDVPCMYDLVEGKAYYNKGTGKLLTNEPFLENYPFLNNNYSLPAGYKKCVYLQSNGTQWINTQVIPDNETGLYFKALQLSYGNLVPMGVEENDYAIYPPRYSNKDLYYRWGSAAINMMTWDKADDLIFSSYLNFYNSKIVKFNSDDTDVHFHMQAQAGTFTIPIWLFSINYNAISGKWAGRIYRAQITQGETLIHDYVPCLDDSGRPCMYDLIEQTPLYNQSGGEEFQYAIEHQLPSDFSKLKYLEDTGIQFIDTGVIPTNETGLYVDAQQITHTNGHAMGSGLDTSSNGFGVPRYLKGNANSCGFMWKTWNSYGNIGCGTRFEGYLNLYNDRTATLKTAGTTEKNNTLGELGFTPTVSIYMFKSNHSTLREWKGRIYRAKITQGTELIRDFVPAYDTRSSKPCMYDLINNVAYYNDGTGEFLYNRDFEGTYTGYGVMGGIGNRLGYIQEESGDDI